MDNIQEELRKNEYNPDIVAKESLLKKVIKAGMITAIAGSTFKKIGKAKNIDLLQNDLVNIGISSAITLGVSGDDDYISDIGSIGAISALIGYKGILKHKVNYSSINDFEKVYNKLQKADEIYKNLSLFTVNFNSNVKDFAIETISKAGIGFMKSSSDNVVGKIFDSGKEVLTNIGQKLIINPINEIRTNGLVDGTKKIANNLINHSDYEVYQNYFKDVDINSLNMMASGINFNILGIKEIDYSDLTKDNYKRFIKYRNIEKNTTFTDIIGRYTSYDKNNKNITANISKLLEDDAHFGNALNILADNFKRDYGSQGLEVNEESFISYLNDNGFNNIVNKYYKKDNHISYGEISDMLSGKIDDIDDSLKEHLYLGKKSNLIESDYNNNILFGLKNNDILKNFSFTNVVERTNGRIIDNTALDGFNTTMNVLSIFEKNMVGHYKGMIGKTLNMWSPFGLIQSNSRIKNNIHNNFLRFTESNGVIIDEGFAFSYNVTSTTIRANAEVKKKNIYKFAINDADREISKIKIDDIKADKKNNREIFTTIYKKSDSNSFKVDFKKTTSDILNEDYHVRRSDLKNKSEIKDIYSKFREKGFKEGLQEFSFSNFNPFGIRYEKDSGFRRVTNKNGYYKDGTIFNDAYDFLFRKNDEIDYKSFIKDNERIEKISKILIKDFIDKNFNVDDVKNIIIDKKIYKNIEKKFNEIEKEAGTDVINLYKDIVKTYIKEGQSENFVNNILKLESLSAKNPKLSKYSSVLEESLNNIEEFNKKHIKNYSESVSTLIDDIHNNKISKDNIIEFLSAKGKEYDKEYVNKLLTATNEINENKNKAKSVLYNSLKNKFKVKDNNIENYFNTLDVNDKDNIFYNVYNEILAFENSKFYTNNKEDYDLFINKIKDIRKEKKSNISYINNILGDNFDNNKNLEEIRKANENMIAINNFLKNNSDIDELTKEKLINKYKKSSEKLKDRAQKNNLFNVKNQIINDIENIDSLNNDQSIFKKIFNNKEDYSMKSYDEINNFKENVYNDYFERYQNTKISEDAKKEIIKKLDGKDLVQFKSFYTNLYYKVTTNNNYISSIVNSSFEKTLEAKSILQAVDKFINNIKTKYSGGEYLAIKDELLKDYITSKSIINNHKKIENSTSTFNLAVRNIFSKFQDAAEVIGIERLTNKTLGNTSLDMFKNFFKYRYLPLAGFALGAIALNSFSDMIVPDEVPLIGNGILGVGTRAYATARVGIQYGLKYTGMLSVLRTIENFAPGIVENGFTHFFDPLMDPSEMIDVYFNGKPIEVKKNRNWFTAGRQSAEGEEFGQYRPHLLYIWGNPSSGIYSNKVEKFFRKDFLLTKYPWYILDPYKEEREAYENYGLVHPKTEQLFKDIPIFGHLLSATIGEIIKPTQYIGEKNWKISDNIMINPNHDERNPYSPKYIEFTEPNRFVESIFEGIEDLKTFSGLPGYMVGKLTEFIFGKTNPYENKVTLSSLDNDTSYFRAYEKLQLGGMFGTTEAIRRLIDDGNSLGTIEVNPLEQKIQEWMPDYFRNGNNIYSSLDYAEYLIPGKYFNKAKENRNLSKDLQEFRTLSMIAPLSENFKKMKSDFLNDLNTMSSREREYFYESLSYADFYGKRDYNEKFNFFTSSKEVDIKIKKKISIDEFIGDDGRRYKLSGITSDFNKLSKIHGTDTARKLIDKLNLQFNVGDTYKFKIATSPEIAVGTDDDGEYIRVDSDSISNKLTVERNVYRRPNANLIGSLIGFFAKNATNLYAGSAATMEVEKIFGNRSAYQEWSYESVQSPYFRDWDNPISSFIEPYYTMSSNSFTTSMHFITQSNKAFLNSSSSQLNILGILSTVGSFMTPINGVLGRVSTSSDYKRDTEIQDEMEKIKFISGEKSFYNMTGNENLKQFSKMLNEQDAVYFEGLVNTTNSKVREKILNTANDRMATILTAIWDRQKAYYNNEKFEFKNNNKDKMIVTNIGAFTGNIDATRNLLKTSYGYSLSKLDNKRQAIINSYRGGISQKEGDYISAQMYGTYNSPAYISSTISPIGNINIARRN